MSTQISLWQLLEKRNTNVISPLTCFSLLAQLVYPLSKSFLHMKGPSLVPYYDKNNPGHLSKVLEMHNILQVINIFCVSAVYYIPRRLYKGHTGQFILSWLIHCLKVQVGCIVLTHLSKSTS